ncbi:MAG TPA: circadian clock KaiB family protein [Vicinamibacterales bacterium]
MNRSDTRRRKPAGSPPRLELTLYVSGSSTSSIRAVANLRRLLREYRDGQVAVSIRDLAVDPASGERDQIAFTPTLCKEAPAPPMRILGDLSNPQPLLELLEFYGVDRKDGHS